jgi:hypothetical protein
MPKPQCHLIGDMSYARVVREIALPALLGELILHTAVTVARKSHRAFQVGRRPRHGTTLRPGKETPLWNELRAQLRPYLAKYGHQANLARLLGLPRQRVNAFVTGGGQMPDAERTLQLLVWLSAVRRAIRPA